MKKIITLLFLILFSFSFTHAALDPILVGASGVARDGNFLLIAADKVPGFYFRYPLNPEKGPRIPLEAEKVERMPLSETTIALDLEGISVLADGRVVVLSEALFSLISETGTVVRYPESFTEFGGIGLEGVAVRKNYDGSSRVAVVWEGGYPEIEKIPFQLKKAAEEIAFRPVVLVHNIKPNDKNVVLASKDLRIFELKVSDFPGSEPKAQRFRAPDLVWHQLRKKDGTTEWGFIVLLSSQSGGLKREYKHLWLQRFDDSGRSFGNPIDFKSKLPPDLRTMNWEGLSWYEPGKSLVLSFDNSAEQSPEVYIVELPQDWK
jgi:hypothetical protein